ncbi:MAG TPA: hypothetical protein VK783_13455 [Bacteroidia bacterium]|jgi:hypothetical protein|nr:hypothetical protein [Bacteroidia bacterium]
MKSTNHQPADTLKKSIDSASERSKESLKTLIDSNSKHFESALEANKKTFDSISKMLYDRELDPSIVSSFKINFGKSVKLSEDTIDSVIDAHKKRIELSVDFTTRFIEIIKNEDIGSKKGEDKLIELVKENLDKSAELSVENMEKMVSLYNEHLNLALNFNKKFADMINSQIVSIFKIQRKSFNPLITFDMSNEWWKSGSEERMRT